MPSISPSITSEPSFSNSKNVTEIDIPMIDLVNIDKVEEVVVIVIGLEEEEETDMVLLEEELIEGWREVGMFMLNLRLDRLVNSFGYLMSWLEVVSHFSHSGSFLAPC